MRIINILTHNASTSSHGITPGELWLRRPLKLNLQSRQQTVKQRLSDSSGFRPWPLKACTTFWPTMSKTYAGISTLEASLPIQTCDTTTDSTKIYSNTKYIQKKKFNLLHRHMRKGLSFMACYRLGELHLCHWVRVDPMNNEESYVHMVYLSTTQWIKAIVWSSWTQWTPTWLAATMNVYHGWSPAFQPGGKNHCPLKDFVQWWLTRLDLPLTILYTQ